MRHPTKNEYKHPYLLQHIHTYIHTHVHAHTPHTHTHTYIYMIGKLRMYQ